MSTGWLQIAALAAALLLAGGSGCSGDETGAMEPTPYLPPAEPGPYQAATDDVTFPSSAGFDHHVQIWFPSSSGGGEFYAYGNIVPAKAVTGVPPDCSTPRPVLLFSHGSGGIRWQSPYIGEHLATRGWIVLAPDHIYNTFLDDDPARTGELLLRRPQDLREAYAWLLAQAADEASPFHGCVDPAAGFAVAGHSFGGYTSLVLAGATMALSDVEAACTAGYAPACDFGALWSTQHPGEPLIDLADQRCWAAVPMAPWDGGVLGAGVADVAVPTAVLGAALDTSTPWDTMVRPLYERLTVSPRWLVRFERAGHASFIGLCAYAPAEEGCGSGFRNPDEVNALTRTVLAGVLDLVGGEPRAADFLPPADPDLVWLAQ